MTHPSDPGDHPHPNLLERFMRNEVAAAERRRIVRHLIAGCSRCVAVTSRLWSLGDLPAAAGVPEAPELATADQPGGRRSLEPGALRQGSRGRDSHDSHDSGNAEEDQHDEHGDRDEHGERALAVVARLRSAVPAAAGSAAAHGDLFERLADVSRRIEEEREQAPRLAAALLADPPAAWAALPAPPESRHVTDCPGRRATPGSPGSPGSGTADVPGMQVDGSKQAGGGSGVRTAGSRPAFLTPAVCEVLLDRSREAGAGEPAVALQAADLALAIAERLDPEVCGATVARGLRVRAWAHVAQARRLGDDLDGAEWALAVAEALASGIGGRAGSAPAAVGAVSAGSPVSAGAGGAAGSPEGRAGVGTGALPLEPAEWAELLVFKAGLFADRGDLRGADRLLGRAAELFHAGADPQRAGRSLVQEGLIRAELGDRQRAVELLRAGVDLLDPVADTALVAANLHRLATLLRGIALEATATAAATAAAETATTAATGPGETAEKAGTSRAFAAPRSVRVPVAIAAHACGVEALQLAERARALYRELGDSAAEAYLWRLQGQIEVALGRFEDAEGTLLAATAALARQGLGREAALAQIELAQLLLEQGRTAEIHQLGLDFRPVKQARDKSWPLEAALLVFQVTAQDPVHLAYPGELSLLAELARFLAPRSTPVPPQPQGRRPHRLERVA
jgi:tetratricopeptide (TPR) repeat protein